ncbi:unnamed protein product [Arabis nemorensis]|uniref:Uncharacterized protein n=1 Tax=Arabis nemorensis TaxID=586526 RepID=A0A565BMH9_9BRAS|nr:unnamed protein product [Arabis nemorensis]
MKILGNIISPASDSHMKRFLAHKIQRPVTRHFSPSPKMWVSIRNLRYNVLRNKREGPGIAENARGSTSHPEILEGTDTNTLAIGSPSPLQTVEVHYEDNFNPALFEQDREDDLPPRHKPGSNRVQISPNPVGVLVQSSPHSQSHLPLAL